jgi:hypothetical protein
MTFVRKYPELPNIYRRDADRLHTSSDGQKFEAAVELLNANYSFKHFGQGRGVTVYIQGKTP